MGIKAPTPLQADHDLVEFDCGMATLNDWLKKRAMKNQDSGASRTFVICNAGRVIGFYALSSGSVERLSAPKNIARNMPDQVPVIVLGRLAIDLEFQKQKLGAALLKDAMLRTLSISQNIGVRSLLLHAISEDAKRFYLSYGFQESVIDPMTLFLSIKKLQTCL